MAITLDGTVGVTSPDFIPSSSNIPTNGLFLPAANTVGLATGSTERLRIDSSGNLGLGVTPSGWGVPFKAIEGGDADNQAALSFQTNSNAVNLHANSYYNGGYKYKFSGAAGQYVLEGNTHAWYNAPSGTAGAAISFTQAMTLDASGNLGIGTTSPGAKLDVSGDAKFSNTTNSILTLQATYGAGASIIDFTASGNSAQNSRIAGGAGSSSNISFYTGGASLTERARIDSSGNLLVGTTTAYGKIVAQGATDYQLYLNSTNTSAAYTALYFANQGVTKSIIYWYQNNNYLYVTNGTGGVYMTQNGTSWTSNSDERLKDIIEPITNAVSKVNSLRAVIGKFKTDEEGTRKPFLIAQDVEIALPEAVTRSKLARSEDETEYLGVSYTDTIPLLVAAIKELTARLEALEAK